MSPHNIAKSAVKPIFSPLPHPTFFVPKSPFSALFPVSNPISGVFSRERARSLPCEVLFFLPFPVSNPISGVFSGNCSRFLPCEVLFFLTLPRLKSDFWRFFEEPLPFLALRSALFSYPSPSQIRFLAIFREIAPPFFLRTPLFAEQAHLSDSGFPLHSSPPPSSPPHLLPFRPSFLPYLHPSPLSLAFLPTFPPLSPINKQTRALSRITHVHVRTRTSAHTRPSGGFRLLPSPTSRNTLCTNMLDVKEKKKRPSQNTQTPHYQ